MSDTRIAKNKAVFFSYSIIDETGEKVEHSDVPIGYVHGVDSGILDKLEKELLGRQAGDVVEVPVSPREGFGLHDPDMTFTDKIDNVPPEFRHIGAEVQMKNENGEVKTFLVSKIEGGKLTVDGNHPLAGKNITFIVKITEVRDATPEEINAGRLEGQAALH
jgi:FKBP-type peptidyl-prolyl cis-trans isomerase SlyD